MAYEELIATTLRNIPKATGKGEKTYCSHISQAPTSIELVTIITKSSNVMPISTFGEGVKYCWELTKLNIKELRKKDSISNNIDSNKALK